MTEIPEPTPVPSVMETADCPAPEAPAYRPPPKTLVREYFEQALVTVVMALFLMTFIAQAVQVPTGSMQNNIHIGDHLFVNKFVFGEPTPWLRGLLPTREIRRGDIIVFKYPLDPQTNYVKRVVGLPGDSIRINGTKIIVNNEELPEKRVVIRLMGSDYSAHPVVRTEAVPSGAAYTVYYDDREHDPEDDEFSSAGYGVREPAIVPPDSYFVLGDNRDNSQDSRYWGFVPRSNIVGRALYVYWSYNPQNPADDDPENEEEPARQPNPVIRFFRYTNWARTGTAIK
ncbi:MAG: signal peptidase I [Acidobacteria bacterium]|nr:signal peptidase I [Acidobacteriota bacterium]MCW5969657.1 signal peptidase I [Blastocatellales bacterium]